MRKNSTASKISKLVNSTLFNPIQVGVELTTDHRYLVNEFFKTTLHFMGQLKRDYEQGKFDERDEFACKCASKMVDALTDEDLYTPKYWYDEYNKALEKSFD